jgi:VWFA-related protein
VYVLVLDDLHVDPDYASNVVSQASRFVGRYLQDRDLMAVVYSSGRKDVGQEFTNNRELLLGSVKRFTGRRPMGMGMPTIEAGVEMERTNNALRMLKFLKDIADWTNTTMPAQRKSIVLFSQGVGGLGDADPSSVVTNATGSRVTDAIRDAVGAATRANASIFALDPRGLATMLPARSSPDDFREAATTGGITAGHLSLQVLADDTGGRALLRSNNIDATFERIVSDASSYYALAYQLPPGGRPGQFHTIAVRVNRPNVVVRARGTYRVEDDGLGAPTATATATTRPGAVSADVQRALNSPVPALGVAISVFAVPFKTPGKDVSVLVVAELGNLTLTPLDAGGRLRDEVELSSQVLGATAVKGGNTDHVHVALLPETAAATGGAIRVMHRLQLPPGAYKLRVAARDGNSGRIGSVFHDLLVPDFNKGDGLAMSGLVLTSARAAEMTTPLNDPRLVTTLDTAPSARRQFAPSEAIEVFAELYDTNSSSHQDVITTRVLGADGQARVESVDAIPSEKLNGNRGAVYPYKARLRLDGFAPGSYLLRIEVESKAKGSARASREVPFTVKP